MGVHTTRFLSWSALVLHVHDGRDGSLITVCGRLKGANSVLWFNIDDLHEFGFLAVLAN